MTVTGAGAGAGAGPSRGSSSSAAATAAGQHEDRGEARAAEAPPDPEPLPGPVFDAHTHLDAMAHRAGVPADEHFVADAMARARRVGVHAAITVGDTVASSRWCVRAAEGHPDVWAAVAVHPTEVSGLTDEDYAELERLARHPKVLAVGETGLDYYWQRSTPAEQAEHFRRHIDLAKRVGKPLMIHDREAHADILRILRDEGAPDDVIFHAFSGDSAMARECAQYGYLLSYPGVVTFTNAPQLREALRATPPESVLIETDAPFLTPHPYRGRPNAPYLLPWTLRRAAEELRLDAAELSARIRETGRRVFGRSVCSS